MGFVIFGLLFLGYIIWLALPENKKKQEKEFEMKPEYDFSNATRRSDRRKTTSERYASVQGIRGPDDSSDDLMLAGVLALSSQPSQDDDTWKGGGGGFSGAGASGSYDDSSNSSYDSGSSDCGGGDSGGGDSGGGCD